ncbi:hypothetical protein PGN35_004855 [Nodosilinea sp. PGN35]|uniref:hypothetical protein n=1 Tax=Nodosilinea sp. PGN35 TaxID=3020489 RepID=UPI0023B2C5EA|nr:hypothetical protein [Nodosilinea sp. TSF1-S3]MDF0367566.1 hypothetical protein [Nodosilinea sp. TSF1-S3]
MSPSLLEQARDGDAAAIAALLSSSLKPKGIAVRAERDSYTLHLWFSASPAPVQTATVAYARRAIERLNIPGIGILCFYGEQTGFTQAVWQQELALLSLPDSAAAAPLPHPATPPAMLRAYRELGLPEGSSLAEIEAVYFRRRAELLKKGDRAALEPLKWAFTTLKTPLEQTAAEAGATVADASLAEDSTVATVAPRPRPLRPSPDPLTRPFAYPSADDTDILSFQNRYSNGLIFPALLLAGMAMNAMPIANALLFGIKIWLHEFGHATVAWLSGRQALPLPIGWTSYNPQRSLFVYIGLLLLLGLLYWAGRREAKRWPVVLALALAVVQFYMTWLLPAQRFDMLMAFGGVGGEIYLAALLMVSFYFPLPNYFRWDFYRFPVVLGAAFCFWGQVWLWQQVPKGKASIPFGSMWGEAEHGDMNQLIDVHGWMPGDIIGTYSAIAHLCLFAIVAVYGYTLFRQHRETFIALGKQWLP